ncbi:ankyrin repeat domain-containing protein [Salmonella enterica]|nr:ankyrin repeat domain-containing protein [Salmonella enterica]
MVVLYAIDILKRYKEEELPEFSGIDLISVNQPGIFGNYPIHVACVRGSMDEINALIHGGADINALGELGNTPLHEAIGQNNVEVVRLLLHLGGNVTVKNDFGDTPFDVAKNNNRQDIIKLLMASRIRACQ